METKLFKELNLAGLTHLAWWKMLEKKIESLTQTEIFKSFYLCNLEVWIFDIENLDYLVLEEFTIWII